ncbi:hypothetical protein GCM10023080_084010 [Streptomyces pseudoechinosporeus]
MDLSQGDLAHPVASARPLISQSAAMGALPTLRAATDPEVVGGQYYGPDGFGGFRGRPAVVTSSAQSYEAALQRHLWTVSRELTGVQFPLLEGNGETEQQ